MVTTGFSKPYVAKYANAGSTVTYSEGQILARGVGLELEINTAEENNFYADNVTAEVEPARFVSGRATLTVDGLDNKAATLVYGLTPPTTIQVAEKPVQIQGYGENDPPYVGLGVVRRTRMNGVTEFWAVILPKIKFGVPSETMNTQGESIDWQPQEMNATILRDDTDAGLWRYVNATGLPTEAEAEAVIKAFFSIT